MDNYNDNTTDFKNEEEERWEQRIADLYEEDLSHIAENIQD